MERWDNLLHTTKSRQEVHTPVSDSVLKLSLKYYLPKDKLGAIGADGVQKPIWQKNATNLG